MRGEKHVRIIWGDSSELQRGGERDSVSALLSTFHEIEAKVTRGGKGGETVRTKPASPFSPRPPGFQGELGLLGSKESPFRGSFS